MPCWFYEPEDLKTTPSRKDAIDEGTEARYRREGARFIIEAGTAMKLRYDTMATGVVYFHRFYMFHSFKEFPRYLTGAACLFLAGKVEETPKKCKDIIRIAKELLPEHHFAAFGDDPKEEIMTYERILLQTIKFDLQVEHPYSYLLKYAKTFKGDKEKIQKLVQMAWTFVNDSLCTTLCLQWEPHITAVAFLYLAGRLSKSDLLDWSGKSNKVKWWESLSEDVSLDIMEDVCHHLLDLYAAGKKGSHGTPIKSSKRLKQKSPSTSDADKPKDEPRVKQMKLEGDKAAPPPPPPPPSKSKSSTSSSSQPKPAVQQIPLPSAPAFQSTFSQVTNQNQPSTSGSSISNQSATLPPSHQGTYSSALPVKPQTYPPFTSVAPAVFTAEPTQVTYAPATQSQYYSQAPPPLQAPQPQQQPSVPSQPAAFTQNQFTNQSTGNIPGVQAVAPQAPPPQYQVPFSNQFSSSPARQNYSVPPPVVPPVGNQPQVQSNVQGVSTTGGMQPTLRAPSQQQLRPVLNLNQPVSTPPARPLLPAPTHPIVQTQVRPVMQGVGQVPHTPVQQSSLPPLIQGTGSQGGSAPVRPPAFQNQGVNSRNYGAFSGHTSGNPPPLMSVSINPPMPANATALATVRITGRVRPQQPGSGASNWKR